MWAAELGWPSLPEEFLNPSKAPVTMLLCGVWGFTENLDEEGLVNENMAPLLGRDGGRQFLACRSVLWWLSFAERSFSQVTAPYGMVLLLSICKIWELNLVPPSFGAFKILLNRFPPLTEQESPAWRHTNSQEQLLLSETHYLLFFHPFESCSRFIMHAMWPGYKAFVTGGVGVGWIGLETRERGKGQCAIQDSQLTLLPK